MSRLGNLLICVALAVTAFSLISRWTPPPYHGDEGMWTALGKLYFQDFFLERDWTYSNWDHTDNHLYGDFGYPNPVVGKYIIGASLFLNNVVDMETVFPGYDYEEGFGYHDAVIHSPPLPALEAARMPMKWLGLLTTVLLFLLIKELTRSWFIGLLSAILFLLQSLVLEYSNMAMMDMPVLFFSLLSLLVAAVFLSQVSAEWRFKSVFLLLFLGLSLGLALSTKLNALLTMATVASWGFVTIVLLYAVPFAPVLSFFKRLFGAIRDDSRLLWGSIMAAIFVLFTASSVFVISNPFLYQHTLINVARLLNLGRRVRDYFPEQVLSSPSSRLYAMFEIGLSNSGPFSFWLNALWLDAILVILGAAMCTYMIFGKSSSLKEVRGWVWATLWIIISIAGVLLWTPYDWSRWYLPLSPIWAFLEAAGIYLVIQTGIMMVRKLSQTAVSRPSLR